MTYMETNKGPRPDDIHGHGMTYTAPRSRPGAGHLGPRPFELEQGAPIAARGSRTPAGVDDNR